MSEMVERVARKLCLSKRNSPKGYPDGWIERHINENWHLFEDDARTAIAAMREPTEDMVARTAMQGASPVVTAGGPLAMIAHRWRLMIDEALK